MSTYTKFDNSVRGPQTSVCTSSHLVVLVEERGCGACVIFPSTHGTHTVPARRFASATVDGMPSTILTARLRFSNPKWLNRRCHSSASPAMRVEAAFADALTGVA